MSSLIDEVVGNVPRVIAAASAAVPKRFPAEVLDSVLNGLEQAAKRLALA